MKHGNPVVKVWKEVYSIYKDVAEEEGFMLSDIVSTVLLEAALEVSVVVHALMSWYDIRYEEALKAAMKLRRKAASMIEMLLKAEEVEAYA